VHEAETAVRLAKRAEATAARQLQQAGLEPDLLKSATTDIDIVMADVPEGVATRVKVDQGCRARFFGLPAESFTGKVNRIAPVITKERRTLRVLFTIEDPKDQLRPGMFAEIGLGTDPRDALLIPTDGVIHIGSADYVMVAADQPDHFRVTAIQVGEPLGGEVEAISGLKRGDRLVGRGAILLKPAAIKSLEGRTNGKAAEGQKAEGNR